MEIVYPRVAGIDVGKKVVAVAVRTPGDQPGQRHQQLRKYRTFYPTLREMVGWLVDQAVTHVAMEATGVYWKPVFHVLCEVESLDVLLVNARHVKNVPGRKTDAKDAEWLAELCEVGLLRGSFIPPAEMGVAPSQGPADLATWRSGGSAMTLPGRCAGWEAAMRFVPGPLAATGQGPHTCGWDGSRPTAARFDPKDHNGGHACISHLGCNGELPAANAAPAADAWVG